MSKYENNNGFYGYDFLLSLQEFKYSMKLYS